MTALKCPACDSAVAKGVESCRKCSSALSLLWLPDCIAHDHYNEALSLAKDPATVPAAIDRLRLVLTLTPGYPEALVVLGKLLAQRGEYSEAIRVWKLALEGEASEDLRGKAQRGIERAEACLVQSADERHDEREEEQRRLQERIAQAADKTLREAWHRWKWRTGPAVFAGGVAVTLVGTILFTQLPSPGINQAVTQTLPEATPRKAVEPAEQPDEVRAKQFQKTLDTLASHLAGPSGAATAAALAEARLTVKPASSGKLQLQGRLPDGARPLVSTLAIAVSGEPVDLSEVRSTPGWIPYVVQPGDCAERIARRLCGDARLLVAIRRFSPQNEATLRDPGKLKIGAVLRIPVELTVKQETR